MSRLLVHMCCAHCGAYTVEHWQARGWDVTVLWHNPNIHPYLEHEHRLDSVRNLCSQRNVPLLVPEPYDPRLYFRAITNREEDRCRYCFELRLRSTAAVALAQGFEAFTSTLLISPQQKHDVISQVGLQVGEEAGLPFLYEDLRRWYSESRRRTKPMDLYRQVYCGCLYSEWERHREKGTAGAKRLP